LSTWQTAFNGKPGTSIPIQSDILLLVNSIHTNIENNNSNVDIIHLQTLVNKLQLDVNTAYQQANITITDCPTALANWQSAFINGPNSTNTILQDMFNVTQYIQQLLSDPEYTNDNNIKNFKTLANNVQTDLNTAFTAAGVTLPVYVPALTHAPNTPAPGTTNQDSVISEYFKWYWYWKNGNTSNDRMINSDYILKTQVVPPVCPSCPSCPSFPNHICTNCGGSGGSGTQDSSGKSLVNNLASTTSNLIQDTGSGVKNLAEDTGSGVKNLAEDTGSGLSNLAQNTGSGVSNLAQNTGSGLSNLAQNTGSGIKNFAEDTGSGIKNFAEDTASGIKNFAEDTGSGIKNLFANDQNAGQNVGQNAGQNVGQNAGQNVGQNVGGQPSPYGQIRDQTGPYGQGFYGQGSYGYGQVNPSNAKQNNNTSSFMPITTDFSKFGR
jgi:hypothetical protein